MSELATILGGFGDFVSSLAVIVTLIYLATQVRQTNRLIRHQGRHSSIELHVAGLWQAMEHAAPLGRVFFDQAPEVQDRATASNWLNAIGRIAEYEWRQTQEGFLDEEALQINLWPLLVAIRTPGTAGWWSATRKAFDQEFVHYIENLDYDPDREQDSAAALAWVLGTVARDGAAEATDDRS